MKRLLFACFIWLALSPVAASAQQQFCCALNTYSGTTKALSASGYSFTSGPLFSLATASLQFGLPFTISYNVQGQTLGLANAVIIDSTNTGITSTKGILIGFEETGTTPPAYGVFNGTANSSASFNCNVKGQVCDRPSAVNDGAWHNLCYRNTSSGATLYVDGLQTDFNSANPVTYTTQTGYWIVANAPNQIGNVRDIRVYNADIGANGCQQIGRLALQGLTPTSGSLQNNLAALWYMDNCNAAGCADSSGNGNDLHYDTAAPVCTITSPTNGFSGLSGNQNLQATCTDAVTTSSVRWYVDGAFQGSSTTSPFTTVWNTAQFIDGTHTVLIEAANPANLIGTSTSTGTTSNSVAAKTIYYDPVAGNDSNSCLSTGAPCKTLTGVQTKITSNNLHGGDSILQKAGTNLNITDLSAASVLNLAGTSCAALCPVIQNTFPGPTITIGTYGGSGNCHVLAGVTTDCASITLTGNSFASRNGGIFNVLNVPNVVIQNFRLFGSQPDTFTCPGTGGGCNSLIRYGTVNAYVNGSSVNTTVIQNNELVDTFIPLYVSGFPDNGDESQGLLCQATVQDNYIHGSAIFSPIMAALLSEGANCGYGNNVFPGITATSNYTNNIGGFSGDISGSGVNFTNGARIIVDTFNVTGAAGYNVTSCGAGYGNWWFQGNGMTMKGNESYNQFPFNSSGCDIGAFDLDLGTSNSVMEFNYGHTTWGPTVGVFGRAAGSFNSGNNTIAYNIFENGGMSCHDTSVADCGMTAPLGTNLAGPMNFYNNTMWNGYNGTTDITDGAPVRSSAISYGLTCPTKLGWINPAINNLVVSSAFGTSADMIDGGFFTTTENCTTVTWTNNDFYPLGGVPTFTRVINGGTYTTIASWNSVTGGTDFTSPTNPIPNAGTGIVCYVSGTIPVNPGGVPCPTTYELVHPSPLIGSGINLSSAPYNLTLPTTDYFTNPIPNGLGTGYNVGADGASHQ